MAMAETASNQLHTCLRIMNVRRIPKMSIFMNVTTKGVKEKAQKLPKKRGQDLVLAQAVFLSISMGN